MGSLDESDLLLMAIPHVVLIALSAMILGATLVKAVDRYRRVGRLMKRTDRLLELSARHQNPSASRSARPP
ncbi:unnamed protein product, partial [Mesorhabditis spiculigera]